MACSEGALILSTMCKRLLRLICSPADAFRRLPDAVVPLQMIEGENPADAAPYIFASDVPDTIPAAGQVTVLLWSREAQQTAAGCAC